MNKIYNCSECDYCYSNETMGCNYLCVNMESEYFGELVDGLGIAEENKECVVVRGKNFDELILEDQFS
ncbi:hypothetical protein bpr_II002 (plasmid) [Butyrivibrio proteoclasticus B316]|uniref:Uncharacterized protein n=1 Tax=Butyrivibrio proteoclasticus (strain ATCC 51982 / DSM 14932 / B316) TaxID=515622 RepID=E0S3G1_BUTPB|nr:hypothetical protein [Butyrivibrio proteoclasticus]ADL35943.1 hypothetical protein bpr_II002 [Butyrivibrio proteoclasticus B316]